MKKKLLAGVIAMTAGLSLFPEGILMKGDAFSVGVSAAIYEDEPEFEDFKYTVLEDGTIGIRGYEGSDRKVTVPSEIYGKAVTTIMMEAFVEKKKITEITIPDSVTVIGYSSFAGCSSLKAVNIPDHVDTIGEFAFEGCTALQSFSIPESVTFIGNAAFRDTAWFNQQVDGVLYKDGWCIGYKNPTETEEPIAVTIPKGTRAIAGGAFYYQNNLYSVKIPEGVRRIGDSAFEGCTGLSSITLPNGIIDIGYNVFLGCKQLTSLVIPDSVTEMGSGILDFTGWYDNQADGVLYLDGWCIGYKGTMEGKQALSLQKGTKSVAGFAFNGLEHLTSITIPDSVTSIGAGAFYGCTGLTLMPAMKSVTTIGRVAFMRCTGLTSVVIPEGVLSIGDNAFYDCKRLLAVTIPESVIAIGDSAFGYENYQDIRTKKDDFKIYCKSGSVAVEYAVANGFWYSGISEHKPTKLNLPMSKLSLGLGEVYTAPVIISPIDVNTDMAVTYTSSNPKIVAIDKRSGSMKAVKNGSAVITAVTANGKSDKMTIKVKNAPTKIESVKAAITLSRKENYQIIVALPEEAACNSYTYTSSNFKVASVDMSGMISAKQQGKATITIKAYNGKTSNIQVTVK